MDKEVRRYNIDPLTEKDSRYKLLDRIRYESGEEIIESQNRIIIPKSDSDIYHEVQAGEEGRLDLISHQYYGTPLYWWGIAYASNVFDPFSIKVGDTLRVPPLMNIVSLKGVSAK